MEGRTGSNDFGGHCRMTKWGDQCNLVMRVPYSSEYREGQKQMEDELEEVLHSGIKRGSAKRRG